MNIFGYPLTLMPPTDPGWQLTIEWMERNSADIQTFCWTFAAAVCASILYNWIAKEEDKISFGEACQYGFVCLVFGNLLTMIVTIWIPLEPKTHNGVAGILTLCGFNLALYAFRKSIDPKRTYKEWKDLKKDDEKEDELDTP